MLELDFLFHLQRYGTLSVSHMWFNVFRPDIIWGPRAMLTTITTVPAQVYVVGYATLCTL